MVVVVVVLWLWDASKNRQILISRSCFSVLKERFSANFPPQVDQHLRLPQANRQKKVRLSYNFHYGFSNRRSSWANHHHHHHRSRFHHHHRWRSDRPARRVDEQQRRRPSPRHWTRSCPNNGAVDGRLDKLANYDERRWRSRD